MQREKKRRDQGDPKGLEDLSRKEAQKGCSPQQLSRNSYAMTVARYFYVFFNKYASKLALILASSRCSLLALPVVVQPPTKCIIEPQIMQVCGEFGAFSLLTTSPHHSLNLLLLDCLSLLRDLRPTKRKKKVTKLQRRRFLGSLDELEIFQL